MHKIQPGDDDDFRVQTQDDMIAMRTSATQTMTSLLAGIAGVSLVVGGIGIMNIMLVSVTERTREIGLRMAIGARGFDVLLQFLVEAVVISVVGGSIGIGLGYGMSEFMRYYQNMTTLVPVDAVVHRRRLLRGGRHLLRLLPGAESRGPRPDRSAPVRVARPLSTLFASRVYPGRARCASAFSSPRLSVAGG